jgi:uncharacterized protein
MRLSFFLSLAKRVLIGFFWAFYCLGIKPFLSGRCRFLPSCSHYAAETFKKHSFFKSIFLVCGRLIRCHPFCPGGYDPVVSCSKDFLK